MKHYKRNKSQTKKPKKTQSSGLIELLQYKDFESLSKKMRYYFIGPYISSLAELRFDLGDCRRDGGDPLEWIYVMEKFQRKYSYYAVHEYRKHNKDSKQQLYPLHLFIRCWYACKGKIDTTASMTIRNFGSMLRAYKPISLQSLLDLIPKDSSGKCKDFKGHVKSLRHLRKYIYNDTAIEF